MVREALKDPRPFPRTQIALIEVCLDGRCQEKPKTAWQTHWDPQSRTLWINLTHRGPLKRVAVRLVFGEGECGGYLYYEKPPTSRLQGGCSPSELRPRAQRHCKGQAG